MTAPHITAAPLEGLDGVRHGFFGRQGGVSAGLFASLNCGLGSGDDVDAVGENRARAAAALDATRADLATSFQVHGRDVVRVETPWPEDDRPKIDGMVSNTPGVVLGILTADCVPVLFADADARVIGACHAGWKGAVAGICQATVREMIALGAARGRIKAAIGPCIMQDSYEVGEDLAKPFLEEDPANERFFKPGEAAGKAQFDLPGYVEDTVRLGMKIGAVKFTRLDTYKNENDYFSYRRACHRGEPDYGRNLSAIMLEE